MKSVDVSTFAFLLKLLARPAAALVLCGVLSACATDSLTRAPASSDRPWVAPVAADDERLGYHRDAGGFSVPIVPEVSQLPATLEIDPIHPHTLPQLIDIAQQQNPETRLAWNRARQAALAVGVAEASFLPMLSANVIGGWQKTRTPINVLPGNHSVDTEIHGVVPILALEWLIFDFGQRRAIVDGAKHTSWAANVLFNAAHQKIILDVSNAYYQYGSARTHVEIAEQTLENSRLVAQAVDERMKAGLATTVETAQVNQQVAQAKLRVVNARGFEKNAYQTLLAAAGLPPTQKISIDRPADQGLPLASSPLTEQAIKMALAQRPDVLASYAATKAAQAGITAAEAAFMPKVYLGAVAAHNRNSFDVGGLPALRQQTASAGVLLGLTIPLYDAGLRSARLKDAEIEAAKAADVFRQVQQAATREIIAAVDMLESALAAYHAATELESAARTTYDAALESYGHGLGTITVTTTAVSALMDAQEARADAHAAALSAAANLAFVMGKMTNPRDNWLQLQHAPLPEGHGRGQE